MKRLLCALGLHTGQKQGGTMMFTCPRCKKSLWQRRDLSAVTRRADRLIEQGRGDEALRLAREAVRR